MDSNAPTHTLPKSPPSLSSALPSNPPSHQARSPSTLTTHPNPSTTSLASTTSSTSPLVPKWNIHIPQYNSEGQKLDAMARKYPAPEQKLSVEEMLALPPLPRTLRFEIGRGDEGVRRRVREEEEVARRKIELEEAKRLLRGLRIGER